MECFLQHDLIHVMKFMINLQGYGNEYYGYNLPNLCEPGEKDIEDEYFEEGVKFHFLDNKVQVISNQEFIKLLEDSCKIYIESHPDKKIEILKLLEQAKKGYTYTNYR